MARFESWRAAATLSALGAFVTCVPLVEQDDRPCPCSGQYQCCETTQTCLLKGETCPSATGESGSTTGGSANGGKASGGSANGGKGSGGTANGGGTKGGSVATTGGESGGATGGDPIAAAGAESGGAGGESGCSIKLGDCSAYQRTANVLVLIYNPLLQSGQDVRTYLAAPDARSLSAELAERLRGASGGLLNYRIVEAREIRAWPPQRAGAMPLNEQTFLGGVYDNAYVNYASDGGPDGAQNADYGAIFAQQKLCEAVQQQDISEIWLWGAHSGEVTFGFEFFSYRLAGDALPAAASDADRALYAHRRRNMPDCGRTLMLLGAQYSEGLDSTAKAHRSYNFRVAELLDLSLRTRSTDAQLGQAAWEAFSQYELGPGDGAQVGTPVFPPNAGVGAGNEPVAWDYTNLSPVISGADRWFNYPALTGTDHELDCTTWGCSNEGYQIWYSQHLPRNSGTSPSGSCANWWKYVADPLGELAPCCGEACHPGTALGLPCASDSDCASGHCACAGAAVCVENAVAACGKPNWSLCGDDATCASGVCGCNGGPAPKTCLPSEAYPRDCAP